MSNQIPIRSLKELSAGSPLNSPLNRAERRYLKKNAKAIAVAAENIATWTELNGIRLSEYPDGPDKEQAMTRLREGIARRRAP